VSNDQRKFGGALLSRLASSLALKTCGFTSRVTRGGDVDTVLSVWWLNVKPLSGSRSSLHWRIKDTGRR